MSLPGMAKPDWWRVFAAPLCLAAVSSLGFVAAFLWNDIGRYLCWLGVGLPLVVIAWMAAAHMFARRNS